MTDTLLHDVATQLTRLIEDGEPGIVQAEPAMHPGERAESVIIRAGGFRFAVVLRRSAAAATVTSAVNQAKRLAADRPDGAIPIVAVPYMGETGDRLCTDAGVGWLDLSGNARIKAPGLRILIAGQPNRFKERGRPASVFAPKSARIARWFLMHPGQAIAQQHLAEATGLDEGFTSRIVARLISEDLIRREAGGRLRLVNAALLLDAWRDAYDFTKHTIIKGHVNARTGPELVERLAEAFQHEEQSCTLTGLAAAWQMTTFAAFRLATAYLPQRPDASTFERLGFREGGRGANTWLIIPNDGSVFQGARNWAGIRCVHPIQAYLDLKAMPERADEAAERLRETILAGAVDG